MRTFVEKFDNLFNEIGTAEQVSIFNEWAYNTHHEPIYYIEEFDEIMTCIKPLDLIRMAKYGGFDANCNYFTFDGYGNLESIENASEFIDDYISEMADYYEENPNELPYELDDDEQ